MTWIESSYVYIINVLALILFRFIVMFLFNYFFILKAQKLYLKFHIAIALLKIMLLNLSFVCCRYTASKAVIVRLLLYLMLNVIAHLKRVTGSTRVHFEKNISISILLGEVVNAFHAFRRKFLQPLPRIQMQKFVNPCN